MENTNTKLAEVLKKLTKEYDDRQRAVCKKLVEQHYNVFAQKAQDVAANGGTKASVRIRSDEATSDVLDGLTKRLENEGLKNIDYKSVDSVKPSDSSRYVLVSAEWSR